MSLLQGGDGGDELRQRGTQSHEGQGNHRLRNAQLLGDDGAVLYQQVGTVGNEGGSNDQQHKLHGKGAGGCGGFCFLGGFLWVSETLADVGNQVYHKNRQHDDAQPSGEGAHPVGCQAVDRGGGEEEENGHLHGLHVHGAGIAGYGNGRDQSGIADDGADGVAVGHGSLTQQGTGGGHHYFRQCGADGDHRGTDDDVRQTEPAGDARGTVNEPVAALDEQNQAQGEKQNRNKH